MAGPCRQGPAAPAGSSPDHRCRQSPGPATGSALPTSPSLHNGRSGTAGWRIGVSGAHCYLRSRGKGEKTPTHVASAPAVRIQRRVGPRLPCRGLRALHVRGEAARSKPWSSTIATAAAVAVGGPATYSSWVPIPPPTSTRMIRSQRTQGRASGGRDHGDEDRSHRGDCSAAVVPRDSRVSLSPGGGTGRINGAIAGVDGARDLINTIKANFGIPIDNYVEVDFAGFKDLVDTLGGVPVYFAAPVRDKNTGLTSGSRAASCSIPRALAYARARHFQYQDTNGNGVSTRPATSGGSPVSRTSSSVRCSGPRKPGSATREPQSGSWMPLTNAVVMDQTLNVGTILDLVDVFRTFNPDDLDTNQIPTFAAPAVRSPTRRSIGTKIPPVPPLLGLRCR